MIFGYRRFWFLTPPTRMTARRWPCLSMVFTLGIWSVRMPRSTQPISDLPGGEPMVTSRQWLRASADDTWARVTLSSPLPEHLVSLLDRYGSDAVVAASLRSVTEERPRSRVDLVAVDIDGQQVGVLSATQTANLLPLVRRAETDGRQIFCRASLRCNSLKADVALHARKAHELDEIELKQLFAHRPN